MNAAAALTPPDIDILVESERWRAQPEAEATVRQAVAAAAGQTSTTGGELAIVLTDDQSIRRLNLSWRGIDKATNVLSFPIEGPKMRMPALLGDIVIAYETTAREADLEGKPFFHHLAHLAVHGFLHLIGHDHEDDDEAERMERLERIILERIGIQDPYQAPDARQSRHHA